MKSVTVVIEDRDGTKGTLRQIGKKQTLWQEVNLKFDILIFENAGNTNSYIKASNLQKNLLYIFYISYRKWDTEKTLVF